MKVSVIIPFFNEEKSLADCIKTLQEQTYKELEIILIDDGSSDKSIEIVKSLKGRDQKIKLLKQDHKGPGAARNLGAKEAQGDILVFMDADMTFDKKFIEKLTKPIRSGYAIGTFSKNEMVLNKKNIWSKCWNFNKGLPFDRMHPKNYPDTQSVFRAILKKAFLKVGGFDLIGYVDDHTLAAKLGTQAVAAKEAFFYHRNPESLGEIYRQARWVGKNEYKRRKIKNQSIMRIISIVRYSLPLTLINGFIGAIRLRSPIYLLFKIVYDFAIEVSLIKSFFKEQAYK